MIKNPAAPRREKRPRKPPHTRHPTCTNVHPIVVSTAEAMRLGCWGKTKLFELIAAGELESFLDCRVRRITVASIQARIQRKLQQAAGKNETANRRTGCAVTVSGGSGDGGGANIPIPPSVQLRSAHQIKPPQPRGGNKENSAVDLHASNSERNTLAAGGTP